MRAADELCDADDYEELMAGMVAEDAPRLFAVVQDYRERVDGRIAGWGLAFEDRVELIGEDGSTRITLSSVERATRWFTRAPDIAARVVWVSDLPPEALHSGRDVQLRQK